RWKKVAGPGDMVLMRISDGGTLSPGEKIAVRDENLCVEGRDIKVDCDVIICRREE
ncbi:MAG TPA: DUF2121 domain-containing protein, partial [Methanothermobacter thermautotrophicus]|nr:DUF2121 domain-containing protein [Methanothermobacter thermautotrophicus]